MSERFAQLGVISDPFIHNHNRMKEALVVLGRQKAAYARLPLMKLSD
jgi:hypothetical protein